MRWAGCFIVSAAVACSDDHTTPSAACGDPTQISLPVCTSGSDRFSDEACTVLDDAISSRASTQDGRAATVVAPAEGERIAAGAPYTFTWTAPVAWRPRLRAPRAMTFADELARWTTLVPEAQAHCEPFTGRAYELRFVVDGRTVFRRQTSATVWTPTTRDWGILTAGASGGRVVELTIYTALFNGGTISASAGPFRPMAARRFSVL